MKTERQFTGQNRKTYQGLAIALLVMLTTPYISAEEVNAAKKAFSKAESHIRAGSLAKAKETALAIGNKATDDLIKVAVYAKIAKIEILRKNYDEAERMYRLILDEYGDSEITADGFYKIACSYCNKSDRRDRAIEIYNEVIRRWPQSDEAISSSYWVVTAHLKKGDLQGALQAAESAKLKYQGGENAGRVIRGLGNAFWNNKQTQKALELHLYNVQTNPADEYAQMSQSRILTHHLQNKDESAFQSAFEVLVSKFKEEPGVAKTLYSVAEHYAKQKDRDKAYYYHQLNARDFQKHPYAVRSKFKMIKHHIENGELKAAQELTAEMISECAGRDELPTAVYDVACLYRNSNYTYEARAIYQCVTDHWPDHNAAVLALRDEAKMCVKLGDKAGAEARIKKLKRNYADFGGTARALYEIGEKYRYNNGRERALELYAYAGENFDGECALRSRSSYIRFRIKSGQPVAAAEIAEMIADYPNCVELPGELLKTARSYISKRNYAEAVRWCDHGLTTWPEGKWQHQFMGEKAKALISYGEYDEAQALIDKLIADHSERSELPGILNQAAGLFVKKGLTSEALALYERGVESKKNANLALQSLVGILECHIGAGDDSKAQKCVDKMLTQYKGDKALPGGIDQAANSYFKAKRYQQALNYSNQLMSNYDLTSGKKVATLGRKAKCCVGLGDVAGFKATMDQMLNDHIDHDRTDNAAFSVIHFLCDKAFKNVSPNSRELLKLVPGIVEKMHERIEPGEPGSWQYTIFSESLGMRAGSYYALGDYAKAVSHYTELVDNHPKYLFRARSLGYVIKCYQYLQKSGDVDPATADSEMLRMYKTLHAEYPNNPAARGAQKWIRRLEKSLKSRK